MAPATAFAPAAQLPANRLFLRLFGAVRLLDDGVDVSPRGRKARALVAFLAVIEQRRASRERIADLLWSDRGDDQARASLRQTVAELRAGRLGDHDAIAITRDAIGLAHALVSDRDAMLDAARDGCIDRLAGLLGSCHGMFLDDLDGLSPGYDDWLRGERVRQHDGLVSAALGAVTAAVGRAEPVHINSVLSTLERLDPGNEHVVRLGLRADHAAGDTASLHRRYRRLTDELARELGIRPSEETRRLFNELTALQPVRSLAVAPSPAAVAAAGVNGVDPPIIMVSPLSAVDGAPETATIAAICTDDIRVALASHRDLRVIGLEMVDLERIAAICSDSLAGYMLSGKLRRVDGEMRINIQLGNIASGLVVWSEQLRIDDAGLSPAIDRIVARAAGAAMPAIERDLAAYLPKVPAAHDIVSLYARARQTVRLAKTLPAAQDGAALLEQVIAREDRHLGAHLLLARLYNSDFWQMIAGHDVAAYRAKALDLARRAAAIEPDSPQVQLRLAWCHLRRRDWTLAERRFSRALEMMPYDADGMNEVGVGLWHLGDLDRAEPVMQRAFLLNPFPPADYHADFAVLKALRADARSAEEHFEVSGERGVVYQSLRLANMWHLHGDDVRTRVLAGNLKRDFAAIWQQPSVATSDDMLEWVDDCIVLRNDDHRRLVHDGLRAGLALPA